MARKFRSAESYYGNTTEAKKRQRANLIPGNTYQKRQMRELRLNCWWERYPLGNMQFIYEAYENKRNIEDVPKKELKSREFLNNWWKEQDLSNKRFFYKNDMEAYSKETRTEIFKDMEECLKEKLALLEKG
jgi:hypothetical protein